MPTYYVADDIYSFRSDCKPVKADKPHLAAEMYATECFDSGDADTMRPIEVIVADDERGTNAVRFMVKRTVIIEDEARECGEVDIPEDEDD